MYRFYNQNITKPLSIYNNTPGWNNSPLGKLAAMTAGKVYLGEILPIYKTAEYCWRVVSAVYSQEDDHMTYFRAYDLDGHMLPQAVFGVTWASVPSNIDGGFKYPPTAGRRYYIPSGNNFVTPNDGGYAVTVLDLDYPSEDFNFGAFLSGDLHQNLTISYRLFKMTNSYPNDIAV